MSGDIVKNKQMKLHNENKNKILRELNEICMNQTQRFTCDLDSPKDYLVETNEKSTPTVEDLLMDMDEKVLKKFDEYSNSNCYRCKHFLNIPKSLSKSVEEISSSTKEYEDNLAFVQAIVWLKSAIKSTKHISIEQFHLAFYKQWNNIEEGKNSERRDSAVSNRYNKSVNAIPFDANKYAIIASTSDDSSSNDLSWDAKDSIRNKPRNDCERDLIRSDNHPSVSCAHTPERSFASSQRNTAVRLDCVIADSSNESDIFEDASECQETDAQNEGGIESSAKSRFAVEESANMFSFVASSTSFSPKSFSRASNRSSVDSSGDESSDITVFNGDCSARKRTIDDLGNDRCKRFSEPSARECVRTSHSSFTKKIPSVSSNKIDVAGSPPFDSGYDTNARIAEHFASEDDDYTLSTQQLDFLTPLNQKRSGRNSADSLKSMHTIIEGENNGKQELYLSFSKLSSRNEEDEVSPQRSGCLEENEHEVAIISVEDVNETKKVSSQLLSFTLNALSVDDVAFQSVKIILAIFQDETIAERYMRKRCWENTLEAEAVNAILDFQVVFEAENKTDACTREILQTVTNTLEKCIKNTVLNKTSILIHQISIILKFCDSMPICIETINYLTGKLKSHGTVLTSLMNNKTAEIHNVINQLHMISYALSVCLEKYRLAFPDVQDEQFEEVIPSVINLWKNQSKVEGVMVKDTVYTREQRWSAILNDFIVVAIDNFLHIGEKLRRLSNMLTRK